MTQVIARCPQPAYLGRMAAAILRVLTLIALVLMPAGMTFAPAAATPVAAGADHNKHCDDQDGDSEAPRGMVDCTAMCSAVPAAPAPVAEPAELPSSPPAIAPVRRFSGIILDIATPPPRIG